MNKREWAERAIMLHQTDSLKECKQLIDYEEMVTGFEALFVEHEAAVREELTKRVINWSQLATASSGDVQELLMLINTKMESRDSELPSSGLALCPGP